MAATAGNDTINGTAGNDIIDGLAGDDVITGALGVDTIYGGTGRDRIVIRGPADVAAGESYAGGGGVDTLWIGSRDVDLSGVAIADDFEELICATRFLPVRLTAAQLGGFELVFAGAVTVTGGGIADLTGAELVMETLTLADPGTTLILPSYHSLNLYIEGSAGSDTMKGSNSNDSLKGNGGDDILEGGGYEDRLWGGAGADRLYGGAGDDYFILGAGEHVAGDRYDGGEGYDYVRIESDTTMTAAQFTGMNEVSGAYRLTIGARDLAALSQVSTDSITINRAGAANLSNTEVLSATIDLAVEGVTLKFGYWGDMPDYVINGSGGSDRISGGGGRDTINGGGGNDFLDGGWAGRDRLVGGAGDDSYRDDSYRPDFADAIVEGVDGGYDILTTKVSVVALGANVEKLVFKGISTFEATGNPLDNVIMGGTNNDYLSGRGGADILHGGIGRDMLAGGGGADRFVFETKLGVTRNLDTILDFTAEDFIVLDRSVFTAAGAQARLSSDAFVLGTAAADAEDRLIYDQANGYLFYDADGTGAGAQVIFVQLNAGTALSAADFQIVA